MVKSYRGEITEVSKEEEAPAILVSDHMATKLITFSPDQSIYDVIDTLLSRRISGGPVVNEDGELVGVISEGDCLKQVVKGKYDNHPNLTGKVEEYMATNVTTISPETNIFEAAKMFLNHRLRRFPVVREGKIIGQISQKDIMRAVTTIKSSTW